MDSQQHWASGTRNVGTNKSTGGKKRAWRSYRGVGRDEQGWRAKMRMELGGAVESLCLEKGVQHGSSEKKQKGSGEGLRQGKEEQQEVFGPMTAPSQQGMSRTVLTTFSMLV